MSIRERARVFRDRLSEAPRSTKVWFGLALFFSITEPLGIIRLALSGFFTEHGQYIGVLEVMAVVVAFLFCLWALFWRSYLKYLLTRKPRARPNIKPPSEK